MGELVPHAAAASALIPQDPEAAAAQREERIKQAQELEVKLKQINEELPTRIYNVAGSCAGAGSGDFHYYRQIRRTEQDRLRRIDAEHKVQSERQQFEAKQREAQAAMDSKAAKKRAKRLKKKTNKKAKTGAGAGAEGAASSSSDSEPEQPKLAGAAPQQQDLD